MGTPLNTNTTGGLLQGIGQLLAGLSMVNDPQKRARQQLQELLQSNPNIRDQYIQQYQGNPDAINALLGKRPIIGRSNYDQLYNTIAFGTLSPQAQAANAKAKADLVDAQNRQLIGQQDQDILKKGQLEEQLNPQGMEAQFSTENGKPTFTIPVSAFHNPEDRQRYEELLAGGIQTPAKRKQEQALAIEEQARAASATGMEATREQEEQHKKDSRLAAARIIASLPKGSNVYQAVNSGKISNDDLANAMDDPGFKNLFDEGMNTDYRNNMLDIEKQRLAAENQYRAQSLSIQQQKADEEQDKINQAYGDKKYEVLANTLMKKASAAGISPVDFSYDDAMQVAKNPKLIQQAAANGDPKAKVLLSEMNKLTDAPMLNNIRKQFTTTYQKWQDGLKGKAPTIQDIKKLNDKTGSIFAGTGVQRTVYGLDKNGRPVVTDGDPRFYDASTVEGSSETSVPSTNSLPELSADDKAKAKSNPAYAKFLATKGYKLNE